MRRHFLFSTDIPGLARLLVWLCICGSPAVFGATGLSKDAEASALVSWDQCGVGRILNRTFACDTDFGTDTIAVSLWTDFDLAKLAKAGVFMYVCFHDFTLPAWWQVLGAGGCRYGAFTVTAASPAGNCTSAWDPVGGSTQAISLIPATVLNGFRFYVSVSVGDSALARDVAAGQEVGLARLVLNHTRTTDPDACLGCTIGANIGADFVWLYTTDGNAYGLSSGSYVTWQDETLTCRAYTPVINRTWGSIKALYR